MSSVYNANDQKSEDNAARLAAALLKQYGLGIECLFTHEADVPEHIFFSYNSATIDIPFVAVDALEDVIADFDYENGSGILTTELDIVGESNYTVKLTLTDKNGNKVYESDTAR